MKLIYLTVLTSFLLTSCGSGEEKKEEAPKEDSTATSSAYKAGEEIDPAGALNIATMLDSLKGKDSMEVKLTAKINEVCQVKGCWMTVDLGNGEDMRVRFKDYAFFVPKDANGKTATMQGWVKVDTIGVDELKHLAGDAGKSKDKIDAIKEPKPEMTFMASGVIIE